MKPMLPEAATIIDIQEDNYRTKTFVLDARIDASPGQFVMVWLPGFDEKPFSLVESDPVTLMITEVGPFTRLVHGLATGDQLWIRGPLGQGFSIRGNQRNLALIGGGYGIAPLLWLAQTQLGTAEQITVITGARTAADILYVERFERLGFNVIDNYQLYVSTDDGSRGHAGRVTDLLQPLLLSSSIDSIFACGPHGMLAALEKLGEQFHIPRQLSWEAYMRCGIGICGSCEHAGALLCIDGPVLQKV